LARRPVVAELGRIFEVLHSELALFRAEPAFVADVGVTAALVERGEYPLHFRWRGLGGVRPLQPANAGLGGRLALAVQYRTTLADQQPAVLLAEVPDAAHAPTQYRSVTRSAQKVTGQR